MYPIFVNCFSTFIIFCSLLRVGKAITAQDVVVTGPGMIPHEIHLPARYFFIHSSNSQPLDEKKLKVMICAITEDNNQCRIQSQVLNRKDGSFLVRFKVYEETCYGLTYNITYGGSIIQRFPFIFGGPIHNEECYSPDSNIDQWLEIFQCKSIPKQIQDDLSRYPSVNFQNIHKKAIKRFNNSMSSSVCHYAVKSNQVYRTCYGQHIDFKMFMDAILLSLARKVNLPDLEFYANLGDWPLMPKDNSNNFPVFSWCGSDDTDDIVMPTYDLTESTLGCMGRVSLDMLSVQSNNDKTWDEKENKAFWRGRDASRERLRLIELSREHPELINASLTNFFFFPDMAQTHGPKENHVSFFKFFDYKYQLSLDGTVAAYRFPYLLAGDALVFKQDSKYYEHFYHELEPWKHYIPIKSDLSDLVENLKWALENDEKAQEIGRAGTKYARENILPQDVFCYHAHLFNEWSKKLESQVVIRKGMELVKQTSNKNCRKKNYKDEL